MAARDTWDTDVANVFLNTAEFAEAVTYDSPRDSISSRSINAVVFDTENGRGRKFAVHIYDTATTGVTTPRQGATVTLSDSRVLVVQGFVSDEGMHVLFCISPEANT